jgi:hypothetical protein
MQSIPSLRDQVQGGAGVNGGLSRYERLVYFLSTAYPDYKRGGGKAQI